MASGVEKVVSSHADGINIDIEAAATSADSEALTALTKKMADAIHEAVPTGHVTYDTPSEGLIEEGGKCGTQYGRLYDYKGAMCVPGYADCMPCEVLRR